MRNDMDTSDLSTNTSGVDNSTADFSSAGIEGLGIAPYPLATFEPIVIHQDRWPISSRTGMPTRSFAVTIITISLIIASTFSVVGYWLYWWRAIHMTTFPTSANLIAWLNPLPGSVLSVVSVCLMAICAIIMTAFPMAAAHHIWWGKSWSRTLIASSVVSGFLAIVYRQMWMWAVPLCSLVALAISFLPFITRYLDAWKNYRDPYSPYGTKSDSLSHAITLRGE